MKSIVIFLCFVAFANTQKHIDWSKITPVRIDVPPSMLPSKSLIKPRIVGGQEAIPHAFPHQAGIFIDGRTFCGGCIISERHILTAAHCLDTTISVEVVLGAHKIQESEDSQQRFISTNFVIHEQWSRIFLVNDVALVVLSSNITFNDFVQPIRLPAASDANNTFAGATANVTGWGRDSDASGGLSPVLRWAQDLIITNNNCRSSFSIITSSNICLNGRNGRGTCNGDSGGPLTIKEEDGIPTLIGTTSFGSGWGCEWGFPTAYARMTSYTDWIVSKTDGYVTIRP